MNPQRTSGNSTTSARTSPKRTTWRRSTPIGKPGTRSKGQLFFNGKPVGENHLQSTDPLRFSSYSGMDIGKDNGEVVSPKYKAKAPFAFTAKIVKVVFDLAPHKSGALEHRRLLQERFRRVMRN